MQHKPSRHPPTIHRIIALAISWHFRLYAARRFKSRSKNRLTLLQWQGKQYALAVPGLMLAYRILTAISMPGILLLKILGGFFFVTLIGIIPSACLCLIPVNGLGNLLTKGRTSNVSIMLQPSTLIPLIALGLLLLTPIVYKHFFNKKKQEGAQHDNRWVLVCFRNYFISG